MNQTSADEISTNTIVTVLGAGAWGLALADHLARKGATVRVWDREPAVLNALRQTGTADRPAGLTLPRSVGYFDTIEEAAAPAQVILSVVPSFATRAMAEALKPLNWAGRGALFVNCSKGIEPESLSFPYEAFEHTVGQRQDLRYAVLAGPSHAEEVSRLVPTALVASAPDMADAILLQQLFFTQVFRVYTQSDYRAVELGGAAKNVLAVAAGISDGKNFGDNTKAALITRGLAEVARLAAARGSTPAAIAGLSGLGDLIVTTMSQHSRNRTFGELIAHELTPEQALERIGAVVEGYLTAKSLYLLAQREQVEMPLVTMTYRVLHEGLPLETAIESLLSRGSGEENW